MTRAIDHNESGLGRSVRRCYAVLLVLLGSTLLTGGVMLAVSGGSIYYLLSGLVVGSSGVLIWRRDRWGVWLYGAMLLGTVAWAIWEVGFEPWLLVPRLVAPYVLGLGLLLPPLRRMPGRVPVFGGVRGWPAFAGGSRSPCS